MAPVSKMDLVEFFGVTKYEFMREWVTLDYAARCHLVADVANVIGKDPVMHNGSETYSLTRLRSLRL